MIIDDLIRAKRDEIIRVAASHGAHNGRSKRASR